MAAPGFRVFGTQYPPVQYGGRKLLSRAFRNRFLELHFDQLPTADLETILEKRCALPRSYSQKMVAVLGQLQKYRRGSAAFAGREGFITLRDLFKWAERYRQAPPVTGFHDWDQHLAEEGFLVVAARVRNDQEETVIRQILAMVFKRTVDPEKLFSLGEETELGDAAPAGVPALSLHLRPVPRPGLDQGHEAPGCAGGTRLDLPGTVQYTTLYTTMY